MDSMEGMGAGEAGAEGMRSSNRRAGRKRSRGKRRAWRTRRAKPGSAPAETGEDGQRPGGDRRGRRNDGVCLKDVTRAERTVRAPLEAGSDALVKGLS